MQYRPCCHMKTNRSKRQVPSPQGQNFCANINFARRQPQTSSSQTLPGKKEPARRQVLFAHTEPPLLEGCTNR
jgi:hypothetical protein